MLRQLDMTSRCMLQRNAMSAVDQNNMAEMPTPSLQLSDRTTKKNPAQSTNMPCCGTDERLTPTDETIQST